MPPKQKLRKGRKKKKVSHHEITRRAKEASDIWKVKMRSAEDDIEEEKKTKLDLTSDLARQYKTMQMEMALKIHSLESTVANLNEKIYKLEEELKSTKSDKDEIIRQKNFTIQELQLRIDDMEATYEAIVNEALDDLSEEVDTSRARWEKQASLLELENRQALMEFGLNPGDL
ncbi:uncharacterized protein TRIADDRAFT_56006 [Trichoplax adhaerens]|uniref:Dynein regulatory complex protein 12 n=1 Tax=Trichoplax adhaerens TaxID=10228 RepID=B3RTQ2_TRIAD|nr:hypothetical protein TRIADDRAFT_56006 [Trichoplax adhaerens]EDV25669.1 hypothetical protein TRIADDRAFT_56006 [Trichoplax adhaerens]|eukprot:XP_002111702.1 hypothetical protein TRIADDRAFT_56006 [Trichoplax adhaerens]